MIAFLVLQVLAGLLIGFYFTDKKHGISYKEVKFGAIVIMIVTSIIIFTSDPVSFRTVTLMLLSGIVLFGAIFIGEVFHVHLIAATRRGIQKENVQAAVSRFVDRAKSTANQEAGISKEVMDIELYKALTHLKSLSARASFCKQEEIACKIDSVTQSCIILRRLSLQIGDRASYQQYVTLADELLNISWVTLSQTEQKIQRNLSKNWQTIAFAMKAVTTK